MLQQQPNASRPAPGQSWSRLRIDFAWHIKGTYCSMLLNALSKWPEVTPVNPDTFGAITALRRLFAHYGLPDQIVHDIVPQFTRALFRYFSQQNNVQQTFSSQYHPQSMGRGERFVYPFKRALFKLRGEGKTDESPQQLLVYHTTPNRNTREGITPAEVLMSRHLKIVDSALVPSQPSHHSVSKKYV